MPVTIRQVITDALQDVNVLGEGQAADDAQATTGLRLLRDLIDLWNADRLKVYADQFTQFVLTPSLSPHTIGPTGATWTVPQRPVTIEGASLMYPGDTDVWVELNMRDAEWWHGQTVPDLETDIPTDLYYNPTWPNGELFFWPVPSSAKTIELFTRVLFTSNVLLTDTFTLPPGYKSALTKTLAEEMAITWSRPITPALANSAMQARARVFANNDVTPRLTTQDAGMPKQPKPSFNYLTGSTQA